MRHIALILLLLGSSQQAQAERYVCSFIENDVVKTETLTRAGDSFSIDRSWRDGHFRVEIAKETLTAIFLLENFQHPTNKAGEDSGSFLLRVVDRQAGGYIWSNQRFADSYDDYHYRGTCQEFSD